MRRRHASLAPLAASVLGFSALAAVVGTPAGALGQEMFIATTRQVDGGPSGPISRRSVAKYADLLGLDDEQRAVLDALHEGYAAEAETANERFRDAMTAARQAFEDTGDPSVLGEEMPKARRAQTETLERLEARFFADLEMLLTDAQRERVPALERMRRRETLLPNGSMSGESVDLIELVDGLDLPDGARSEMAETVTQYELELDRALQARDKIQAEAREAMERDGGNFQIDEAQIEKMRENGAKAREASLGVKSVNDRYARILASQLPADVRDGFTDAYQRESFPQVYRESSVRQALGAAEGFDDLTPDQRRAIAEIMQRYEREADAANRRWADAIEEDEQSDGGAMAFGGGMMIRLGMEDEDSPLSEARKTRREIDQHAREKLMALLTEDQRQRLPKRREREGNGVFVGEGVATQQMIIEIEDDVLPAGGGG